ncbi:hypothetical protein D3C72_997070 [compost metagenome]
MGHRAGQPGLVAHGGSGRQLAGNHPAGPQPGQDPRRAGRHVRAEVVGRQPRPGRKGAAHRDPRDRGPQVPQGRPGQGRHRQVPGRPARRAEGGLRRHHHQRALDPAPHAEVHPHRLPGVLRPGARRHPQHRRDQGLPRRRNQKARRRHPGRPGAPGRALPARGRLRHQEQAQRLPEDGADRRYRRRR